MVEISLSKFLDIAGLTLTNDEYDTFQAAWVSAHNLQVGDSVHIIRHAASVQFGWRCEWADEMNAYVGASYEVEEINEYGIKIKGYHFPFFVLQVIEQQNEVLDQSVLRIPL